MKKFFRKNKKYFILGTLVVLIFVADGFLWFKIPRKNKSASGTCAFNVTATPTATPIDPKIKEFGLKIEKLNILAPIIKDVNGTDKDAYNKALKGGVAHFKGTSLPGEKGNIFIFGHSSAEVRSDYSKIFASLNDLEKGDEIVVFYQNDEHKYKVAKKEIIEATETSVLNKGKKEKLTLMTCWPIGTKEKRLIVVAEPD